MSLDDSDSSSAITPSPRQAVPGERYAVFRVCYVHYAVAGLARPPLSLVCCLLQKVLRCASIFLFDLAPPIPRAQYHLENRLNNQDRHHALQEECLWVERAREGSIGLKTG
jgi:hypothetical protein